MYFYKINIYSPYTFYVLFLSCFTYSLSFIFTTFSDFSPQNCSLTKKCQNNYHLRSLVLVNSNGEGKTYCNRRFHLYFILGHQLSATPGEQLHRTCVPSVFSRVLTSLLLYDETPLSSVFPTHGLSWRRGQHPWIHLGRGNSIFWFILRRFWLYLA